MITRAWLGRYTPDQYPISHFFRCTCSCHGRLRFACEVRGHFTPSVLWQEGTHGSCIAGRGHCYGVWDPTAKRKRVRKAKAVGAKPAGAKPAGAKPAARKAWAAATLAKNTGVPQGALTKATLVSPPSPARSEASTQAADAIAVGVGDAAAAHDIADERKRLWMKYLRTRQPDSRSKSGSPRTPKAGTPEKLPEALRAKVDANLAGYFDIWVKNGCSWGQVMAYEETQVQNSTNNEGLYEWLYGFQVRKTYPADVAEGWIASYKDDPERYQPDACMPENDDAAMFKILTKQTEAMRNTTTNLSKTTLQANVADMGEAGIAKAASFMNSGSGSSTDGLPSCPVPVAKTPEQIAAEEAEKQRKIEERKAVAKDPIVRCKRWLNGLPKDIQTVKDTLKEIEKEEKVPELDKEPSRLELTDHLSKLEITRRSSRTV